MEVIAVLPVIILPFLFFPLVTGWAALSMGRKFWFWFFVGIPLPFIAIIILLCLPEKHAELQAVPNEELYDHLFKKRKNISKTP